MNHVVIESAIHRPWRGPAPPTKILAIRFHAFGDVVITLPYLQTLKNSLPGTELHLMTREECADIPRHASMFSKVYALDDHRSPSRLAALSLRLLPALIRERYDIVIDLQRNSLSRLIRRILSPKSFSEFKRFTLVNAGERVRRTIHELRLVPIGAAAPLIEMRAPAVPRRNWSAAGYSEQKRYLILNPAGSSITKNWPIEHYAQFARLWNRGVDSDAVFLIVGTSRIAEKTAYLKRELGGRVIDLVNATSASEALMLVRKAELVLSEDSGLMHMAWISRVPLVALFGATPSVWSAPLGESSVCLDSSDLECGNCNKDECVFGDVRCLARYSAEYVFETARSLLERIGSGMRRN